MTIPDWMPKQTSNWGNTRLGNGSYGAAGGSQGAMQGGNTNGGGNSSAIDNGYGVGQTPFGQQSQWTTHVPTLMQNDLLKLLSQQTQDAYDMYPAHQAARKQAVDAISPVGRQKAVDRQRSKLQSQSFNKGRELAQRLKGATGQDYSQSTLLDAMNSSNQAGNDFQNQQFSGENELLTAMQAMGITDPNQMMSLIPTMLNLNSGIHDIYKRDGLGAYSPPPNNMLGSLLGTGLGLLTGGGGGLGGLSALFGAASGGGGNPDGASSGWQSQVTRRS